MFWTILTISLSIFLTYQIVRTNKYKINLLYLALSSLYNIPIILLGNSSSSGVFVFDLILVVFGLKYIVFGHISHKSKVSVNSLIIFQVLLFYILFRTLFVYVEDYGYYNNFILYGCYRWCTFALFFYFASAQPWKLSELIVILRKFYNVLLVFFFFAVIHQLGFLGLSGYEAMGMDEIFFENEEYADFFFRTFLGNISPSIGFISVLGVILSLLFIRLKLDVKYAVLGLILSAAVLLGSWSRSDLIALIFGLVFLLINNKKLYGKLIVKLSLIAGFFLFTIFTALLITDNTDIITENRTYQRFFETKYAGELKGDSDGTFSYRLGEQGKVIRHMLEHGELLLFGFGPNGYRMVAVRGVSQMGFGHNVYLHTIGELGLVGAFFVLLILYSLFFKIYNKLIAAPPVFKVVYILPFILLFQRLIAGYAVDTIFAVDNILPMTIIFLFFIVIISRIKYVKT